MYIDNPETDEIDYNELATLKHVVLADSPGDSISTSSSEIASELGISKQTATRRLQQLEQEGLIVREVGVNGQRLHPTEKGTNTLLGEYEDYRRIFNTEMTLELDGTVTSGLGEGKHYISLSGYQEQFEAKLGYVPFPGTLNVALDGESLPRAKQLGLCPSIEIDGWEDDGRTFGPVTCYAAEVETGGRSYGPVHALDIERTHHDEDLLEIIGPDRLRDELELSDGDGVTVRINGE